ncbi:MAG: glycerophosphodiester phosphodiesterase family protein [Lacipirellulaceae bacterium]
MRTDLAAHRPPALFPYARSASLLGLTLVATTAGASVASAHEPLVIAHRGASGYLPEHTLVGVAMAYGLGADMIEQDVVLTSDGVPIVLHDLTLDATTDVARVFPGRAGADGKHYAADFTLEEVRRLRVTGRRAAVAGPPTSWRFPADRAEGLALRVPTLADELDLVRGLNSSTGGEVGVIVELKEPAWHRQRGMDLAVATLAVLAAYGYENPEDGALIQCFDATETRRLRADLGCQLPLCQLLGGAKPATREQLAAIASQADSVGPPIDHVLGGDGAGAEYIDDAHAAGLAVYAYTLRRDALPDWAESEGDVVERLTAAGIDGYFTDFPGPVATASGEPEGKATR